MLQKVLIFLPVVAALLIINVIHSSTVDKNQKSATKTTRATKKVFQPPEDSDISQIKNSETPWVIPELIPKIEQFKKYFLEDIKSYPSIQKIMHVEIDSDTTRAAAFKLLNKYLSDIGHPTPSALANIVSNAMALFSPLTIPTVFDVEAIKMAEFLITVDVELADITAQLFASSFANGVVSADPNDGESVLQGLLTGFVYFTTSIRHASFAEVDRILQLFASELIVLHNK